MLRSRKSKSRRLALETRRLLVQPLEVRQMLSINEPPTIAPVGPQNLVRDDNTGILPQLVFSSGNQNLIVVDDVDAGGAALEVSLEAEHGVLSLSQVAGLTFLEGDGSDDATISFTGSLANINAALAGMQFDAEQTFSGVGTLTVTVDDLGNTGDGGPCRKTGTFYFS